MNAQELDQVRRAQFKLHFFWHMLRADRRSEAEESFGDALGILGELAEEPGLKHQVQTIDLNCYQES